jgi:hypothetical protein
VSQEKGDKEETLISIKISFYLIYKFKLKAERQKSAGKLSRFVNAQNKIAAYRTT